MDVKLLEVNLPFVKTDLENLGYPDKITPAKIRVSSVTFIDGSEWSGDVMLYPDPNNPREKINPRYPIDKQILTVPKPSSERSALPGKSPVLRFLNAGVSRAHAPAITHAGFSHPF